MQLRPRLQITELETVASDAATLRREVDSLRSRAVEVESEAEKRLEEELAEAREQLSQAKKHALEARTEAVKMVEEIELETQEKVRARECNMYILTGTGAMRGTEHTAAYSVRRRSRRRRSVPSGCSGTWRRSGSRWSA